jgi:hypothetical protein
MYFLCRISINYLYSSFEYKYLLVCVILFNCPTYDKLIILVSFDKNLYINNDLSILNGSNIILNATFVKICVYFFEYDNSVFALI